MQHSNQALLAQAPVKLRSTFCTGGSSKTFSLQGQKYYVVQSMGQSSVIGLSQNNKYILRQGFIQPPGSKFKIVPLEILKATVYPNPFSNIIIILIAEDISDILHVTLIDMNGKISYQKTVFAAPEIKLNVESLPPSVYFLTVHSTTKCYYSKMIKL